MSLVARRQPHLPPIGRRTMTAAAAIVAIVALGAGTLFVGSRLGGYRGSSGPPQRGGGTAVATPTPVPSESPTAAPTATPKPSALATLDCTIAVAGRWAPGSGGFLSFPDAQFKPDPASNVKTPDEQFYGLMHSLALNRWLPVPRDWVTADGRSYVYIGWDYYGQVVKLVAADGSTRSMQLPVSTTASGARQNAYGWHLITAETNGIYVARDAFAGTPGLWRIGYDGSPTRLVSDGYWQAVWYPYAYGTDTPSVPEGANNTLVRLDLRTGARDNIFSQPELAVSVFGFAADGTPVVQGRRGQHDDEIWLATADAPAKLLTVTDDSVTVGGGQGGGQGGMGPGYPGLPGLSAIGDSHGLWIATTRGLYLYTTMAGVEKASGVAGPLGSTCR